MTLQDVVEYFFENYPDSALSQDEVVKKDYKEEWCKDFIIDRLIPYYMYDCLGLCGCGIPEETFEVIRKYLHIKQDKGNDLIDYYGQIERYKRDLEIQYDSSIQYGMLQFLMYILDDKGFTAHGSSIGSCWLTEDGERLLTVLDAWYETKIDEV